MNAVTPQESGKKPYVTPQLIIHGSVQKLTERVKVGCNSGPDCGSQVKFPVFGGGHGGSIW
jgi:hypothetical protein